MISSLEVDEWARREYMKLLKNWANLAENY